MSVNLDLDLPITTSASARPDFRFRFDGVEYSLPGQMDIRVAAAMESSRFDDGLRLLLGPKQWDAIQASSKLFTSVMFRALYDAYTDYTTGTENHHGLYN